MNAGALRLGAALALAGTMALPALAEDAEYALRWEPATGMGAEKVLQQLGQRAQDEVAIQMSYSRCGVHWSCLCRRSFVLPTERHQPIIFSISRA
jgi:hypothetical protein